MKKVFNIDQAKDFFLINSEGSVVCVDKNDDYEICNCFPEAEEFFNEEVEEKE